MDNITKGDHVYEKCNNNENQILLAGTCIHETIDQYKQNNKAIDTSWNDKELNELIARWKDSIYKGDESKWQKRIEWDNLSVNDAYAALASIDSSKINIPEWYNILNKVRVYTSNIRNKPVHSYIEGIADRLAFGHIWIGACDWSIGYLLNNLSEEQQKIIENKALRSATIHLIKKLALISQKATLRLFNAIRPKELVLIRMNQANSKDRQDNGKHYYNKFVETQVNNGLENLLCEYPGLGRLIGLTIIQWERSCHEIVSRLHLDRLEIADSFSLSRDFRLTDIQLELGDCHNNGKSVSSLTLKSGHKLEKLVYKPRSIEMESAYASFIHSINSTDLVGKTKPLKTLKSLKRYDYGYIEFLESTKIQNNTDLSEFYFNAGRIAAVLYLLGCTDCHYENFVAADNQLHLIDAETIMEPLLRNQLTSNDNEISQALAQLKDSVLRLGMLPGCWLEIGKSKQHVEISCLATNVIDFINEHKQLVDINTDAMHYQTKKDIKKSLNSSPYAIGEENKLHEFVKQFNEGLEYQLSNFSSNKAYYQKRLQMFEGIVRRLVPRPTQTYATLLRSLYKPKNQSSAFNMSTTLECLWRAFVLSDVRPQHFTMAKEEIRQIFNLDIPYFCHHTSGYDLLNSEGHLVVEKYIDQSGYECAYRRLSNLNKEIIDFQIRLANGSLSAYQIAKTNQNLLSDNLDNINYSITSQSLNISKSWRRQEAVRIADLIWSSSIVGKDDIPQWLGVDLAVAQKKYRFGIIDFSLYSGKIGIAILFARVGLHFRRQNDLPNSILWSKRSLLSILDLLEFLEGSNELELLNYIKYQSPGLAGIGGILIGLNSLIRITEEINARSYGSRIQSAIELLIISILQAPIHHPETELMAGCSGLIGPLIKSGKPEAIQFALDIGGNIVANQAHNGGWLSPHKKDFPPLIGFAHGTSSIALALVKLHKINNDTTFIEAARKALDYERRSFDSTKSNWPDYRHSRHAEKFMMGWCSGSPGICLSRIGLMGSELDDDYCHSEITEALKGLKYSQFSIRPQRYDHLCCGNLGLCSILEIIKSNTNNALNSHIARLENWVIARSKHHEYHYSLLTPRGAGIDSPSLFTGMAGIGLYFAESADTTGLLKSILMADLD